MRAIRADVPARGRPDLLSPLPKCAESPTARKADWIRHGPGRHESSMSARSMIAAGRPIAAEQNVSRAFRAVGHAVQLGAVRGEEADRDLERRPGRSALS